jgi:DNA helicase-2/ATP-dependent DNA helicase PcrA
LVEQADHDLVDFGDMIERAYLECPVAPGNPTVGFFDECQDMSALEWALVRRWAGVQDYVVCVGDDDQAIYEWRGASAESFLNPPLPDEQIRVLSQSYRVPNAVHSLATRWISRVRGRQPKDYRPRSVDGVAVEGAVRRPFTCLREREAVVGMVERYAASGRTVAILASCSYMLAPVVGELRRQGVPFHNPWRKSRGDWNPLNSGRGVSTADRLLAWLAPSRRADGSGWTLEELRRWADLASGMLAKGAKSAIAKADELTYADFVRWVPAETIAAGAAGDMRYLLGHVTAAKAKAVEFPARVIERLGPAALDEKPRVIVSTIHGAKGGEADVVILAPDLSRAGAEEWERGAASVRRLFYVGMTRAREELVILAPTNGRMAVEI